MDANNPKETGAGDDIEVLVERILPGGPGLSHERGKTILVPLAAPGDRLRVRIDRVKGQVGFASIKEILEPSPVRVEPPCPYFGRCGGCDFQQLNYGAQLDAKAEIIRDCLRRIGRFAEIPDFEVRRAPNEWHYRARAQWQYDSVRRRLGYFESGSRRVCDVAECAVLAPDLQRELERLREQMTRGELPDDARHFRAVVGDNEISIADDNGRDPTVKQGAVVNITRTIGGETYRLDAASFFQANSDLLPQLIDEAMGEARGKRAIELYCGVGLFTLPLARRFESVVGVENDKDAIDFARRNLAESGLANVKIVSEHAGNWLAWKEHNPEIASPDFLLLDPPRTGAESRVITGILNLKPKRICYVSCDPATLARDLKKLCAGGYAIERLVAFDMFPQTHHVETVVHLSPPSN